MEEERKIRVLLAKSELEGHDRGVKYIAHKLRENGMEVIYTTFFLIKEVVDVAIQEDVDVIGVTSSTGAHLAEARELQRLLRENHVEDRVLVIMGGIIPSYDWDQLREYGVKSVFSSGSTSSEAVEFIRANLPSKTAA